jgi:hypothetical protein
MHSHKKGSQGKNDVATKIIFLVASLRFAFALCVSSAFSGTSDSDSGVVHLDGVAAAAAAPSGALPAADAPLEKGPLRVVAVVGVFGRSGHAEPWLKPHAHKVLERARASSGLQPCGSRDSGSRLLHECPVWHGIGNIMHGCMHKI